MQTLIANSIVAIVVGIPNALVLVLLFNAWSLRTPGPTGDNEKEKEREARRQKSLADGAKIARNCMIFVSGAAAFYFGLSLGEGRLDPAAIQLCLEGLLGAILPLIVWRWCASMARQARIRSEIPTS
ncbi:MAG TPA: hypothetical protein VHD63_12030 [Ktedonobacteraceae bacterium]|jgi:hypothetical protein|nr:hypothetical protein [Ktedonobacteraceae bacterium]